MTSRFKKYFSIKFFQTIIKRSNIYYCFERNFKVCNSQNLELAQPACAPWVAGLGWTILRGASRREAENLGELGIFKSQFSVLSSVKFVSGLGLLNPTQPLRQQANKRFTEKFRKKM